jgi:hypothetical protein
MPLAVQEGADPRLTSSDAADSPGAPRTQAPGRRPDRAIPVRLSLLRR